MRFPASIIQRSSRRFAAITFFLVACAGCGGSQSANPQTTEVPKPAATPAPWTLTFEPLSVTSDGSSTSPQLTVGADRPILSWLEVGDTGTTLKFAERTASGWSEPRVVASGADLVVNAADVPSVRALPDGTLAAHWLLEDGPDPEAYKLPLSISKDGGRTWARAMYPHHDGKKVQHGFASLFQAPGQGLAVVWLDGRSAEAEAPEGAGGSMSLFGAVYDRNGKQISESAIDTRVCECCQTSVAETPEGVIVVYRDRTAEEVRDIYVTKLVDGKWTPSTPVHNDGWKIDGCPVNGPAVSARDRDVAVAWFTAVADEGHTFVAFSHDGARTFGQAIRVDDVSSKGQVDVELLGDGSVAVTWVEVADNKTQFKVRRVEGSGARSDALTVASVFGNQYPRLAQGRGELLFAWADPGKGVHTVRAAVK